MKRGAIEHPKTEHLAALLKIPLAQAVGHFEALIHFTSKAARRGDIGRWTDDVIARKCLWEGDPKVFVAALLGANGGRPNGMIEAHSEHRLIVHDWQEHCDDATKKAVARANEVFVVPEVTTLTGQRRTTADNGCQNLPALSPPFPSPPEPSQAIPSPSQPPQPDSLRLVYEPGGEGTRGSCAREIGEGLGGDESHELRMFHLLVDEYDVLPASARVLSASPAITAAMVTAEAGKITDKARDPPAVLATNLAQRLKVELPESRAKHLRRMVGNERAEGILAIERARREKLGGGR